MMRILRRTRRETWWWILKICAFVFLCAVNFSLLNHHIMMDNTGDVPSSATYTTPRTEIHVPRTFEERIAMYKQKKMAKLKANKNVTETRSLNLIDPDVAMSLKNPVYASVKNMEQYYDSYKILKLGHKRTGKAFSVFGIPTVYRKGAYYLINTLETMVTNLSVQEKKQVIIVIFIADYVNDQYTQKVVNDVAKRFPYDVQSGLIQVITANPNFYPNLNRLPRLYGDKPDRVKWRSKQSLDYSFLYYYCVNLGEYYTQLEDDVIAVPKYLRKMKIFIHKKNQDPWSVLEFGSRGFIGMTYKADQLSNLSKFVRTFFWLMPVDWLFRAYNDVYLYGNKNSWRLKPPLFKHVGKVSSLAGQVRKLEDLRGNRRNYKPSIRKYQMAGGNPPADVSTTIADYEDSHHIVLPYSANGFFWGRSLKDGDSIDIVFAKAQKIKRVVIKSGTRKHPNDSFDKTELQTCTPTPNQTTQCENFKSVKEFNSILVDYNFSSDYLLVKSLRLVMTEVKKDAKLKPKWLIIDEIAVFV